jgi:poly-gamma-glutamate capsule biosynthesis protein CapA/YwtB (metallophosphatase superfamily)
MPRPRIRLAALAAVAAVLAACSPSEGTGAWTTQTRAPKPEAPADIGQPTQKATADTDITLAFAGDAHFTERTAKLLSNPATAIGGASAVFKQADLAMLNLETAITGGGTPEPKEFHFRAPATALTALKEAGIDVTTMANNHALDYGQAGLADTLAAIKASGQPVVGVGANSTEAFAPHVAEVRGTRIAFLGMSQIRELSQTWAATPNRAGVASALDVAAATAAVRAARAKADVVVAFLHWGKERYACPTPVMKTLAKALADAGADAIVSSHAHLLLGDGYLGKTYVQYGLGNFLWYIDTAQGNDTGVLTVTLHGRQVTKAELTPAKISKTGQPVLLTGTAAAQAKAKYARLRACTGLSATPH